MALNANERYKLRKFVEELESKKARGTELISVYVPAGYEMSKIIKHLEDEQGTATNIKSRQTRQNVIDALEKMIRALKANPKTPTNGLAIFSGNVSEKEGGQDFKLWQIEPPLPLNIRLYRCDKEFITQPLKEFTINNEKYGLIVMDKREGNIAYLIGKKIVPIVEKHSMVPGKTRAGGQSSQRFERLREGAAKEFFRKLAEVAKEKFLGDKNLKGILIGGPGMTKEEFIEKGQLQQELKDKIIAIKDLSYTGDFGLEELVEKSEDVLKNEEITKEKNLVKNFFVLLATKPGKVSYGVQEVVKNIKMGAVDKILISESLTEKTIDELEKEASQQGTKVEMISTETEEGVQLSKMGGVAAIHRYDLGN